MAQGKAFKKKNYCIFLDSSKDFHPCKWVKTSLSLIFLRSIIEELKMLLDLLKKNDSKMNK